MLSPVDSCLDFANLNCRARRAQHADEAPSSRARMIATEPAYRPRPYGTTHITIHHMTASRQLLTARATTLSHDLRLYSWNIAVPSPPRAAARMSARCGPLRKRNQNVTVERPRCNCAPWHTDLPSRGPAKRQAPSAYFALLTPIRHRNESDFDTVGPAICSRSCPFGASNESSVRRRYDSDGVGRQPARGLPW